MEKFANTEMRIPPCDKSWDSLEDVVSRRRDRMTLTKDEQLVLRQWGRFLDNGLARVKFISRLYKHLIGNCNFIAFYDKDGFYSYYFRSGGAAVCEFLSRFDLRGATRVDYWLRGDRGEVNRAMVSIAEPYLDSLMGEAMERQRKSDLIDARRLLQGANPDLLRKIEAEFGPLEEV